MSNFSTETVKRPTMHPDQAKHCAYHDAGHAVYGWFTKGMEPPDKVGLVGPIMVFWPTSNSEHSFQLSLFPVSEGRININYIFLAHGQLRTLISAIAVPGLRRANRVRPGAHQHGRDHLHEAAE